MMLWVKKDAFPIISEGQTRPCRRVHWGQAVKSRTRRALRRGAPQVKAWYPDRVSRPRREEHERSIAPFGRQAIGGKR